jgi:hypothetical protein
LWALEVLSANFPRLSTFAADASISVSQVMQAEDLHSLFQLPLSMQAYDELLELEDFICQVPIVPVQRMSGPSFGVMAHIPPASTIK